MRDFIIKIDGLSEEMRLSVFLKNKLNFSSSLITRVKFHGIFVNGEKATARTALKNGDTLKVVFPEEKSENIEAIPGDVDVLYEDEYIIAVNKPRNMPTHPSRGNSLPTLANALMAYFNGNFVFRSINRLDRDTSGIVLIAKDQFCAVRLSANMKSGDFEKKYLALVSGVPEENEGLIDAPIERVCEGNIKRTVRPDGKRAVTKYAVKEILPDGNSICEITLLTGRTHQIRVHLSYIGHPLVNDFLYGTSDGESYSLHCSYLAFTHPINKKRIEITSLPDFVN